MLNISDLIGKVNHQNWKNSTPEQRAAILQDIEYMAASEQGRQARYIMPTAMDDNYAGLFDKTTPFLLQVNEKWLSDEMVDQGANYECLDTVLHEGRHALQYDVINGKAEVDPEKAELWKMNDVIYRSPENGTAEYRFQPNESDSFSYAQKNADLIHEQMPDDQGYDQYLSRRQTFDDKALELAAKNYGVRYEREIASDIQKQYAEYEEASQSDEELLQPSAKSDDSEGSSSENNKDDDEKKDNDYFYGYGY